MIRTNGGRKRVAAVRPKLLAISVAACFAVSTPFARANPTGPSVVSGTAQFATAGSTLSIANSANAVINWQSFSIGVNEITRFLQPSAASAVLNRVTGTNGVIPQSVIDGMLQSNGHVYLLNRSGIVFGRTARIDVAGLVASSLDLSNDDFVNKRNRFLATPGAAAVVNHGVIETAKGGKVYLVAPDVQNTGIIRAPQGDIILAAGKSAELVSESSPYVTVKLEADAERALNVGSLIADAGRVGMFGALVRNAGIADASAAVVGDGGQIRFIATRDLTLDAGSRTAANGANGGSVHLQAQSGINRIEGSVEATGSSGKGGQVSALGVRVGVLGQGIIDASGETGGGTVLVGGDYQGKNPDVQNAERTVIGKDGVIRADARTSGDGGRVIVWADGDTFMAGSISARGGSASGNGGFVETSGKRTLNFTGKVDASAPNGTMGTLVLDPEDIVIADLADGGGQEDSLVRDGIILLSDLPGLPITISAGALESLANDVNIDLMANRSITMQPLTRTLKPGELTLDQIGFVRMTTNTGPIDLGGNTLNITGTASLALNAGTDIKTGAINTNGGGVQLTSGSASPITVNGDILTRGGEVRLTGGDITVGKVHTTAGSGQAQTSVTLLGSGSVTTGDILTGPAPTNSSVTLDAKGGSITAGNITTGNTADGSTQNRGSSVLLNAASTVTAGNITTGTALDNSWVQIRAAAGINVGNIVTGFAGVLSNIELMSSNGPVKSRNLTIVGGAGTGSVIVQTSGKTGTVTIGDGDGAGGIAAGTGDVNTAGGHFVASGEAVSVGNVNTSGGESGAGVVGISSNAGDIVTGSITTASLKPGFGGGSVDISTDTGNISIRGAINTAGAAGDVYGGSVSGSSGGGVRLWRKSATAPGAISVQGDIVTGGGDGATPFSGSGGNGGQGGMVDIGGVVDTCADACFSTAPMAGTIAIGGLIDTRGGSGGNGVAEGGLGGAGAGGGTVRLMAMDGVSVTGAIVAKGGSGGAGGNGGSSGSGGTAGGAGGTGAAGGGVIVQAANGSVTLGGPIDIDGGSGGNGGNQVDGPSAGSGGAGAAGGFIDIDGASVALGDITAKGGNGGSAGAGSASTPTAGGGHGAAGGLIAVVGTSSLTAGDILADGGNGGSVDSNGTAGSGAAGGIVAMSGAGSVGDVSANGGGGGSALGTGSTAGAGAYGGTIFVASNATGFLSALGSGAGNGTITLTSDGDLAVGGAAAAVTTIAAAGAVTQAGAINSGSLHVTGTNVTLDLQNQVSVLGGQASAGDFVFHTSGNLLLTGVAASDLASITASYGGIAGVSALYAVEGSSVLLSAGGALGQAQSALNVRATTFDATANGGVHVNLNSFNPALARIDTLMNSGSGNIVLNAFGGAHITSLVSNPGGSVFLNSSSPLRVDAGIAAGDSIFLSTAGSGNNDMMLRGSYSYGPAGTFAVTIGPGGVLDIPDGILTTERFPNQPNITSFTFVDASNPLANPEVLQAVGTTITTAVDTAEGGEKKDEETGNRQRRSLGACRPA
jgi:trimeric autotransporter adhesin